jgi:hypothetical protein
MQMQCCTVQLSDKFLVTIAILVAVLIGVMVESSKLWAPEQSDFLSQVMARKLLLQRSGRSQAAHRPYPAEDESSSPS